MYNLNKIDKAIFRTQRVLMLVENFMINLTLLKFDVEFIDGNSTSSDVY